MKNTKLIRFVQSFILLPVVTMSGVSATPVVGPAVENRVSMVQEETLTSQTLREKINMATGVFAFKNDNNKDTDKDEEEAKLEDSRAKKAQAIDVYFKKYDMPLNGTGMKMVLEAEKNDIDWRLLPAIAVRESTGGKFACKKVTNSFFGWGSCKINFKSTEEAIEIVAKNLGGNNPNTDHYYAGKTVKEILQKYNPPSIVPNYAPQVMKIMDNIGLADISDSNSTT